MRGLLCIALVFFLAAPALGQSNCPPLQAPAPDPSKLLFTPQQEEELGEIIRQQLESDFLVIEEDQVTGYLKRIGERVARQLPDTGLHYEFLLYDRPETQAFSMPGGRVYVSRKLVAFMHTEDELAGVLGHELGHLAARQQALDLSRAFREVLGLKSLSGDEDLFGLYNQFVESVRLKKRHSPPSGEEEKGQRIADQLGVQAAARAGYAPQAYLDALDRIMETKGRTGNWFTDLFGATRPDSRRLREAILRSFRRIRAKWSFSATACALRPGTSNARNRLLLPTCRLCAVAARPNSLRMQSISRASVAVWSFRSSTWLVVKPFSRKINSLIL